MNSSDYWTERARKDKLKVIKRGEHGIDDLKKLLLLNLKDVEKKIKEFYEKYEDKSTEQLSFKGFEKYKKDLREGVKKYPNDKTLKKILKEDAPKYRIDRLRALQIELQLKISEVTALQEKATLKTLEDTSLLSNRLNYKTMSEALGLEFAHISKDKLYQIINQTWVGRRSWSQRLWKDRYSLGKKLTKILQKGSIQGTPLQKMARELKEVTKNSFNNCFRIIRTETSHIDAQVKLQNGLQAQEDLEEKLKYKYDAFLDARTSKICKKLNGKTFLLDKAETGVNFPPMHPNCRSTYIVLPPD